MEGKSTTEIATVIRLVAAAAQEWREELDIIACSMDVKQVFDNVPLENLSLTMKEMDITPMLTGATMREQIGDRYDFRTQETRGSLVSLTYQSNEEGKRVHA